MLKFSGKVNTVFLNDRDERKVPYLTTIFIYGFNYYTFLKIGANPIILNYLLACMAVLFIVFFVNFFYKISIHTTTLGSFIAIIFICFLYTNMELRPFLASIIILSGLVASARLFAQSHSHAQVYWGFVAGYIPMLIIMLLG